MTGRDKPNSAAGAAVALFITAIAAGYSSADLWQMVLAMALLAIVMTWSGNS
jgi:hypothetical protein